MTSKNTVSKKKSNEILFIILYYSSSILTPVMHFFPNYSTVFLLTLYAILIIIAFFHNNCKVLIQDKTTLLFGVIIEFLFLVDFAIRPNSELINYASSFLRCFVIPAILFGQVTSLKHFLYYWSIFGTTIGIIYLIDPLTGYRFTIDYMAFGFNIVLPAFCGSTILWCFYKKRVFAFFSVLFFFEACVFANKGTILVCLVLFIFLFIETQENGIKKSIIILLIAFSAFVLIQFQAELLNLLSKIANYFSFDSYSINTLRILFEEDSTQVTNARMNIWKMAFLELKNNIYFGNGIGYFRAKYNIYPHNLLLDIFVSSGFFVVILFFIILLYTVIKIAKFKNLEYRIFSICILLMWIIPLNISLTFWDYVPFWFFFIFVNRGSLFDTKECKINMRILRS